MSQVLSFVAANPVTSFIIVLIVMGVVVLIVENRKDVLSKAALYAVAKAEEAWGSSTGQIKFAEVYTYLKKTYPFLTFFVSKEQLSTVIEEALTELKKILSEKDN